MDFQSSVQDIDEVTKKVTVVVGKNRVAKEYEDSVKQVGRSARIDGFRPGKVPRKMVERLLGDRIKFDITNKLINEGLRSAFEEHKLDTVGQPQIDLKDMEIAKELEFSAVVELYPQPAIGNYLNRSIQVAKKTIGDKDVEDTITRLADSRAELKPVEGRVQAALDDVAALSVAVQVEDGEFSRPEPFVDQLGLGRLSKEAEQQFVGMTVGESKDVTVTATEDHPNDSLRGKKLTYRATLHGLYAKTMPVVDDAFAKSLGMEVETIDALKAKIREQLIAEAEEEGKAESQGELLNLLVKENQFKVPSALVDDEIRGLVARYGFAGKGVSPESIDVSQFRPQFEEIATSRIRSAIIIDRIGSQEDVKVEESDRDAMIQKIATQNGVTVEAAKKALLDKSRIMSFLLEVRRTKILDYLMSKTTVEFVKPEEKAKA
jgi:trigger factor